MVASVVGDSAISKKRYFINLLIEVACYHTYIGNLPLCPDTALNIQVIVHKIHNGTEECCSLLIPLDQLPGE